WDWLATDPSGIFDDATETGSVGPLLSVPIFNAGRLRLNVESEEAVLQQLEASLRSQVLVAQEEVENALVAVAQDRLEIDLLGEAARAAERTVDLSLQLYTSGQSDFQDVLQAERSLFSLQDDLAVSRLTLLLDMVELYRALGGGWAFGDGGTEPSAVSAE
ncbi:MAG: TolC family protein, partial [Planctomycetota bacterium]